MFKLFFIKIILNFFTKINFNLTLNLPYLNFIHDHLFDHYFGNFLKNFDLFKFKSFNYLFIFHFNFIHFIIV